MNISKFNYGLQKNIFTKTVFRNFSKKWEGIKGDVNWVDGQFVDGRPNLRKHHPNLPKKIGQVSITSLDFSVGLKEVKSPVYITYSRKKRGAGRLLDIVTENK